jgi:hypothetical protein
MSRKAARVVSTNRERAQVIQRFAIRRGAISSKQEPDLKRMSKPSKERKWKDEVFFFVMRLAGVLFAFVEAFSCSQLA